MFNRILISLFCLIATLSLSNPSAFAQQPKKRIGVLVWADDERYVQSLKGFLDQLSQDGLSQDHLDIDVQHAQSNKAKAMKIAKAFAHEGRDIYFSLGTPATTALFEEVKDTPIVFSLVFNPVDSKIVQGTDRSGNNLTGVTNNVPMDMILEVLNALRPVQRIAILYTPGESNSEIQLHDLQKTCSVTGIVVVPVPISLEDDAAEMINYLKGRVEAVYLSGSSVVGKKIDMIIAASVRSGLITVSHLLNYTEQGMLLGIGGNSYDDGRQAAKMASMVLNGVKPTDIPIAGTSKLEILVNRRSLERMRLPLSDAFRKKITRFVE
ncbi:MAG: ABC transporter substrate-binding protein [Candidatus Omnitrophica bacterium]|nr:ABC transporter substrate-binding protein [Candidatus Omnitrophota bacterium]